MSVVIAVVVPFVILLIVAAALFFRPTQQKAQPKSASDVKSSGPVSASQAEATKAAVTPVVAAVTPVVVAQHAATADTAGDVASEQATPQVADVQFEACTLLIRGKELLDKLEAEAAEAIFAEFIEKQPDDFRGYMGKAEALQQQRRFLMAYRACREGLEQIGECEKLKDFQEVVRLQYKNKNREPAVDTGTCVSTPDAKTLAAQAAAKAAAKPWDGKNPSMEDRRGTKDMMLGIFREQWERIGKAKDGLAMSSYSPEQKLGLSIKGGHQPMAKPDHVDLPAAFKKSVGVISAVQLEMYNHRSQRLLICLYGDIFDVSDRPDKYGADGPYSFFSGKDITWGLVIGADTEENCNHFYDYFKCDREATMKRMQCLCSWIAFYEVEYGTSVGRLLEYESERDLPEPPFIGDVCSIQ